MDSLRGRLLVSNGGLYDPNFRHTVVLVLEHNEEGALGLVLNRPATLTVAEAIPELTAFVSGEDQLYLGGPVQPEAAIVLAEMDPPRTADAEIFGKVALIGELDPSAVEVIKQARVFGGYSGWGPGQLEDEIERNDWIVEAPSEADIFTPDPQHLWRTVLERKGGSFEVLARMPFDPSVN